MTDEIKLGIYRHYKGGDYRVLGCAQHSETGEEVIVYESLHNKKLWVRPKTMFLEIINIDGKDIPRFKLVFE